MDDNYYTVVGSKVHDNSLLYAAEVDCCMKEKHESLDEYCELKTSPGNSLFDFDFSNKKFLKWFLQSHLVSTEHFLIGFYGAGTSVRKIASFTKTQLHNELQKTLNLETCFAFLNDLLNKLKIECTEEAALYVATREPHAKSVKLQRVHEDTYIHDKLYFLPDWFKKSAYFRK